MKFIPDPLIQCDFENVYYPSEDTFLLVDYIKKNLSKEYFDGINLNEIDYVLDIGTGTGILAILFQFFKEKNNSFNPKIVASDILEDSIICAKKNEVLNNFHDEILFIQSDLFKSFPNSLKSSFNIIVFNPPYLPSSPLVMNKKIKRKIDNSWDGGLKGHEILVKFIKEVRNFLNLQKPNYIYYISSSRSNLEELNKILDELRFKSEIVGRNHIFFEDILLNRIKSL
ncbi:MAG: HemK2/MTQ2 family protein methyltransferase [Promethearchaeota archaeon]